MANLKGRLGGGGCAAGCVQAIARSGIGAAGWGGAGEKKPVESARVALWRGGGRGTGGVCASDAFFPFRDGLDMAAGAGVAVVIQPGGSVRDEEVIAAANEHGIAMVFTGERHFRH